MSRLADAIALIDAAMADDPTRITVDGAEKPYGQHYAARMSHWLARLMENPSDVLQLAVRGQHVRRWDIPRADYPMDKPGYFAWRNRLKDHHADIIASAMEASGYGAEDIARMRSIVRKERLKRDPETQALEDCACLVFLENEFVAFVEKKADYDDDKIVTIVAKTWVKMSDDGHRLALELVPALPERLQTLVVKAVSGV
jgi:hypothetical protein